MQINYYVDELPEPDGPADHTPLFRDLLDNAGRWAALQVNSNAPGYLPQTVAKAANKWADKNGITGGRFFGRQRQGIPFLSWQPDGGAQ